MPHELPARASRRPACRSCCSRAPSPGFVADVVELDDKGAAYEGVTHLLRLGYRRVGVHRRAARREHEPDGASTATRRRCATAQVPLDPALVAEGDFRVESGYAPGSTC